MSRSPSTTVVFAIVLSACGRFDFDALGLDSRIPSEGDASSETYRIRLDLDRYTPLATVTDLPLLVVLDDTRFPRALAQPDLSDLRFEVNGETLPHEVEQFSPFPIIWVGLAGVDTPIYLYFGSEQAPAPGRVWSSSYIGVWHLGDGRDASPRGNTGALVMATPVPGKIGSAIDVNNAGYFAVPPTPATVWSGSVTTVTAWLRPRTFPTGTYATVVGRQNLTSGSDDLAIGYKNDGNAVSELVTSADNNLVGAPITVGSWVHLGVTYDGSTMVQYQDGVARQSTVTSGAIAQTPNPIYFGADANGLPQAPDGEYADGQLDEIRIDSSARSSAWIAADHASQSDSWITYGPVEEGPF